MGSQRPLVVFAAHALSPEREAVDDEPGGAVADESRACPDADSGAAREKNLLQCQRTVVVVSQIGAHPRPARATAASQIVLGFRDHRTLYRSAAFTSYLIRLRRSPQDM